jgi:hypothetical protein
VISAKFAVLGSLLGLSVEVFGLEAAGFGAAIFLAGAGVLFVGAAFAAMVFLDGAMVGSDEGIRGRSFRRPVEVVVKREKECEEVVEEVVVNK